MMHSLRVAAATALLATSVIASPVDLEERASRFHFTKIPTPLAGPCDLTEGPDGMLWGEDILVNKIFRLNPKTNFIHEYPIPFTTPVSNQTLLPGISKELQDRIAFSCAIRNGTDGNLYAGNGLNNQLVRINPTTKEIKVFTPGPLNPSGNLFPFNDLYTAEDGMWMTQTTGNVFQFFDYKTEKFTTYKVPTPLALPLGLFVASDGKVYVAELNANKILVFNPKTKKMHEYPLPELAQFPAVIRAERDGWVYFSLFVGNGLGRINMKTHKIELFHTSQLLLLGSEDTIDGKGGVWLSSFTAAVMSRLDTNTLKYSYVPFPGTFANEGVGGLPGDVPPYLNIAVNYGPGNNIWFVSTIRNLVGRYNLDGLY